MIKNPRLALAVYIEDEHSDKGSMSELKVNASGRELGNILLGILETITDSIKEPLRAVVIAKLTLKIAELADKYQKQLKQDNKTNKKNKRNKEN